MMNRSAFTLIEILLASLAAAIILVAVYGVFQRAVKTRDYATERIHQARQRERAANVLRNDLRNAYLSGGVLASTMEGGAQSQKSRFPGYLRFTATTGKNRPDEAYGDVQQVEYYLSDADASLDHNTGTLVRALTRDLLATVPPDAIEEQILTHVQTFEVTFYDGQNWQESWPVTVTSSTAAATMPQAIRVRVQQAAASDHTATPTPLEILVPITTEALTSTTGTTQ